MATVLEDDILVVDPEDYEIWRASFAPRDDAPLPALLPRIAAQAMERALRGDVPANERD